jgi:hypothetical protein
MGPCCLGLAFRYAPFFFQKKGFGLAASFLTLFSEIFPFMLRAKGVALATCSNWLNNFIIVSDVVLVPLWGGKKKHIFTNGNINRV